MPTSPMVVNEPLQAEHLLPNISYFKYKGNINQDHAQKQCGSVKPSIEIQSHHRYQLMLRRKSQSY